MKPGQMGPPLVRVHLSLGTADWTLLNEERHKGTSSAGCSSCSCRSSARLSSTMAGT